jgi:hypothetical protein
MLEILLFPLKFWLALGETAGGSTSGTSSLTRHKKQEMMRKYPDSFDEDGNFTGNKKTGEAY